MRSLLITCAILAGCAPILPSNDELHAQRPSDQFRVDGLVSCNYARSIDRVQRYSGFMEPTFTWSMDPDGTARLRQFKQIVELTPAPGDGTMVTRYRSKQDIPGYGNDLIGYLRSNPCRA